jgi:hypothetical protein
MKYAIPLTALLALAACQADPAATQTKINGGLKTVAASYVCYKQISGTVKAYPAQIADQVAVSAGVMLTSAECQAAIAGGTALVVTVR